MKYLCTISAFYFTVAVTAQPVNNYIQKGNEAYRKADYDAAIENYKTALRKDPANNIARFNLGNSLQKKNEPAAANKQYNEIIQNADIGSLRAGAYYNEALAFLNQKDLLKAIAAFKESLKQDPADNDTRENLQKALNEMKKQQNQPKNKKQKEKPNPKQKKQPPLNKEMMQQKFNELRNQEKQLQKKLQSKTGSNQPEKDW